MMMERWEEAGRGLGLVTAMTMVVMMIVAFVLLGVAMMAADDLLQLAIAEFLIHKILIH